MWLFLLKCFYFMLPAYFANMAPVISKNWFNKLAVPIDSGKNIFGDNKTYRGFIFGILFSVVIAHLQSLLYKFNSFKNISLVDYSNWLIVGFLLGFGALFGDLIKSFIKRRVGIKPGERFILWDQLDFVIGSLIFISFAVDITFKMVLAIIIISIMGHILVNHSAYYLGIRKERW